MTNEGGKRATKKNKSKETYKKYGKYSKKNIRIQEESKMRVLRNIEIQKSPS